MDEVAIARALHVLGVVLWIGGVSVSLDVLVMPNEFERSVRTATIWPFCRSVAGRPELAGNWP